MAAKKATTTRRARTPRQSVRRTRPDPVPMIEEVRTAGAAALTAFENSFLENGASGVGLDGATTKMLKGDSGMQKVVRLSGDGGTYRAVVRVIFREGTTRAAKPRSRKVR